VTMASGKKQTYAQRQELESLFAESSDNIAARARSRFDTLTDSRRPFVLFGAGGVGRRTLKGLRSLGIEPIAFADNNARLWGSVIDELPVWSPQDAANRFATRANFIITIWQGGHSEHRMADTKSQLRQLGCDRVALVAELYWKYPDTFLPYLILDSPERVYEERQEIFAAFDLVADERSRRIWLDHLRFRLTLDYDRLCRDPYEEYFSKDCVRLKDNEVFIDCGAFTGDTIASFVQQCPRFKRIVAFEPDPCNFAHLSSYIATLESQNRITAFPYAVAAQCEMLKFSANADMTSRIDPDGKDVQAVSLDEALREICPTFIKIDVEGAERGALEGARNTLLRCAPVLAVALEHNSSDLWRLPLAVQSLTGRYDFHFRHHSEQGFDLVLYAIPKSVQSHDSVPR